MTVYQSSKAFSVAVLALSVASCANHTWAPGPGANAGDFEPTKAKCSYIAGTVGAISWPMGVLITSQGQPSDTPSVKLSEQKRISMTA